MDKIYIKNPQEIDIMRKAGKKLSRVKKALKRQVKEGITALEIDKLAQKLIEGEGAKPSFKMVDGYRWSTCVNVNDGMVHGIPSKDLIFKKGDVVSVDVGLYFMGFHVDSAFSVGISPDPEAAHFLEVGSAALGKAIKKARAGNKISDISRAIEKEVEKHGYSPIRALVGHGVGHSLHEEPAIPCFTEAKLGNSPIIKEGMTLAIEVMYAAGKPELVLDEDGWTLRTKDGKISALFEETVAVIPHGAIVLTK